MKKILLLAVYLLTLGSLTGLKAQAKETLVKVGDDVPEFVVEMFDGKKIDIKDLKGKIVLINFWATWCPPCQEELKRVQKEIIDKFKGGPVGITTIATALGEDAGTIEEVYEPFLIKEGFMKRTPRGREVTELAYKHLGRSLYNSQKTLFND